MTAQLTPPSASSAPVAAERLKPAVVLGKALRLAIMLVLIAAGLLLVQTYRQMLHDAPPSPAPVPHAESLADSPLSDLLRPGAWSLGDSTWTLARADLSNAASAERLQSLGQPRPSDGTMSALENKVMTWLRRSRSKVIENCRVYDLPVGPARIRAVTEGRDKSERLRLVQIVWRRLGQAPELLEAVPTPAASRRGASEDHLLPLPQGASSLARRWQDSGALSAEVIRPAVSLQQCLREWMAAGWSVQTLSSADAAVPVLLLRRGERILHLCPLQAGSDVISSMLLVTAQQSSSSQGTP